MVRIIGNPTAFSAYPSVANQALAATTQTKISLGSEEFDLANEFDTAASRFTATVAGYYQIEATVHATGTTLTQLQASIYKNGSVHKSGPNMVFGSTTGGAVGVAALVFMSVGDYVELYGYVNGTGTLNVTSGGGVTTVFQGYLARTT